MKNLDNKTLQTTRTNSAVFAARKTLPNVSSIPNTKKLKKKQTQPFFPTYSIQPVKSIQLSLLLEEDAGGDGTEEGDAGADLEAERAVDDVTVDRGDAPDDGEGSVADLRRVSQDRR